MIFILGLVLFGFISIYELLFRVILKFEIVSIFFILLESFFLIFLVVFLMILVLYLLGQRMLVFFRQQVGIFLMSLFSGLFLFMSFMRRFIVMNGFIYGLNFGWMSFQGLVVKMVLYCFMLLWGCLSGIFMIFLFVFLIIVFIFEFVFIDIIIVLLLCFLMQSLVKSVIMVFLLMQFFFC